MSKTVKQVQNMRNPGGRSYIKHTILQPYVGTINRRSVENTKKVSGGSGLDGSSLDSMELV